MRLSTSTNIMDRYLSVQNHISLEECIQSCHKAGYKVLDINLCDMSNEGMPLTFDNWEQWIDKIGDLSTKLGIEFSQSHSAFYNVIDKNVDNVVWREELVRRAIISSGKLGVKNVVLHAGTRHNEFMYDEQECKKLNIEYFAPHIELAIKHGVGIAIENLFSFSKVPMYTGKVDELIDLVDTINDKSVGICWDFGHANLAQENHVESLRKVGHRLVATHVADNFGKADNHILPFHGSIDWNKIMPILKEIGYKGDFTYEIHNYTNKIPLELRDSALKFSYDIGNHLISLAK